jgi:hypothetical protein
LQALVEQKAIADALSNMNTELWRTRAHKPAMMQQLLTGKIRLFSREVFHD